MGYWFSERFTSPVWIFPSFEVLQLFSAIDGMICEEMKVISPGRGGTALAVGGSLRLGDCSRLCRPGGPVQHSEEPCCTRGTDILVRSRLSRSKHIRRTRTSVVRNERRSRDRTVSALRACERCCRRHRGLPSPAGAAPGLRPSMRSRITPQLVAVESHRRITYDGKT